MNSNNHPSAYGYRPPSGFYQPKPPIQEDTLHSSFIDVERKTFAIALKENSRGRFLRVTEIKGTYRATLIIPATGLKDFQKLLADMIEAAATIPPKQAIQFPSGPEPCPPSP